MWKNVSLLVIFLFKFLLVIVWFLWK